MSIDGKYRDGILTLIQLFSEEIEMKVTKTLIVFALILTLYPFCTIIFLYSAKLISTNIALLLASFSGVLVGIFTSKYYLAHPKSFIEAEEVLFTYSFLKKETKDSIRKFFRPLAHPLSFWKNW